jgi:hypothetical protein
MVLWFGSSCSLKEMFQQKIAVLHGEKMKHGRPTWGRFRLQICIKQIKHPFLRIQIEQIKHPFLRIQEAVTGRDDDHQR